MTDIIRVYEPKNVITVVNAETNVVRVIQPSTNIVTVVTAGPQGPEGPPGEDGVQSVVAGSNITVDNTDPQNPIISATASAAVWGNITGTLSNQADLNTVLDGLRTGISRYISIDVDGSDYLMSESESSRSLIYVGSVDQIGRKVKIGRFNNNPAQYVFVNNSGVSVTVVPDQNESSTVTLGGSEAVLISYVYSYIGQPRIDRVASSLDAVTSVFGRTGAVTAQSGDYTKAQVGLGNVDNTSDADKPVSTAQAAADSAVQAFSIQRANHTGTQLASTISDFAAAVRSTLLTGYALGSNAVIAATDTILEAFGKVQAQINAKLTANAPIVGATKTKVTYDANGLVTAGADATTADIADSSNKRYVSDAQLTVISNTSGTNTGDQNLFGTIAVSGQSNVVADSTSDTLTLVAGTNITITTDAGTDSVTINAASGGGNAVLVSCDFGASFSDKAQTVVTGESWVTGTSAITAQVLAPASTDPDEMYLLDIKPVISDIVNGDGFTVTLYSQPEAKGIYQVMCLGA